MTIPKGDYRNPARREHFVYRAFDAAGELLYVGCTMRFEKRIKEHRTNRAAWIPLVARLRLSGPYNYDTARRLEAEALRSEDPAYGMTPQAWAERTRRNRWIDRRYRELLAAGLNWVDAVHQSCAEAERISFIGTERGVA